MTHHRPTLQSYALKQCCAHTGSIAVAFSMLVGLNGSTAARGDEFSRLEGPPFFNLVDRNDTRAHTSLTVRELDGLPVALRDERAAFVIVRTDQGNLAKMLISQAFRKLRPSAKETPLVPVLIIERFETIDAGDRRSAKAGGKELTLFDGFRFDLDAGQVVPEGLGGDVVFLTNAPEGPRLKVLDQARLYTLEKPPAMPASSPGRPSAGRAILPGDFSGRYRLMANGQWSGSLVLEVDAGGAVTGHFRSDRNGTVSSVTGKVAADLPQKIEFAIQFPRARQSYEGFLWVEGKNAIAGSVAMLERPYGFIAVRDGTSLGSEIELGLPAPLPANANRRVVTIENGSDRFTLDGAPRTEAELADALTKGAKDKPATVVVIRAHPGVAFERLWRALSAIRAAGVTSFRLAPAGETGDQD
jgi:hypothetical protein